MHISMSTANNTLKHVLLYVSVVFSLPFSEPPRHWTRHRSRTRASRKLLRRSRFLVYLSRAVDHRLSIDGVFVELRKRLGSYSSSKKTPERSRITAWAPYLVCLFRAVDHDISVVFGGFSVIIHTIIFFISPS